MFEFRPRVLKVKIRATKKWQPLRCSFQNQLRVPEAQGQNNKQIRISAKRWNKSESFPASSGDRSKVVDLSLSLYRREQGEKSPLQPPKTYFPAKTRNSKIKSPSNHSTNINTRKCRFFFQVPTHKSATYGQ